MRFTQKTKKSVCGFTPKRVAVSAIVFSKSMFIFLIMLMLSVVLSAQTTIPGGNVSGTWTVVGSPYLVQGNITIAPQSSLTIDAGATVYIAHDSKITVEGTLMVNGTSSSEVLFASPGGGDWAGIVFINVDGSTISAGRFIKCGVNTAITAQGSSNIIITDCTF